MIKKILPFAMIGAALISSTGCKHEGEFKSLKGFEYKIVRDAKGKKASIGDIVEYQIIASIDTMAGKPIDTLGDSWKSNMGHPAVMRVDSSKRSGEWPAVFQKLGPGDSAVVILSCDTLMKEPPPPGQKMPPWLKKGNKITLSLSVVSIKSEEEYKKQRAADQEKMQKEMQDKMAAQMPVDDKMLQDYFAKNNIKPTKTESGLYYVISKDGSGATPKQGQMVSMKYIGKTLDGKQFDANMDEAGNLLDRNGKKDPFTFPVGQGRVIKGWDEGVMLLKKGAKATLYIPSPLGYGPQAMGPELPANSILVFNVEVMDISNAPAPKAMGPGQGQGQGQGQQQQQ